jgi:hypothetical protein
MRDVPGSEISLDPIGVRTLLVRREFGVIAMRQKSVASGSKNTNDTGSTYA